MVVLELSSLTEYTSNVTGGFEGVNVEIGIEKSIQSNGK